MKYNYSKLLGKITEVFGTRAIFAEAMGMSERTLSLKLNSVRSFKQTEISRACTLLGIDVGSISDYFFAIEVQLA